MKPPVLQLVKFSKKSVLVNFFRQLRHRWVAEIISIIKKTLAGNKSRSALPPKLVCPFLRKVGKLCQKLKCTENVNLESHSFTCTGVTEIIFITNNDPGWK